MSHLRLGDALYPDSAATSALQRKAALKAAELLSQMGDADFPLSGADDRTRMQFTGKKYANIYGTPYPAVGNLNQAHWLANETRKMNRANARKSDKPAKGGF